MSNTNPLAGPHGSHAAPDGSSHAVSRLRAALIAAGLALAASLPAPVLAAGPLGAGAIHSRERDVLSQRLPARSGGVERFDVKRVAVSSSGFRPKAGGTVVTVSVGGDPVDAYGVPLYDPATLRGALSYVSTFCGLYGPFTIDFSLPAGTVIPIASYGPLPPVTCDGTLLDASTNGGIGLDGSALAFGNGLSIGGNAIEVRGLTIENMPGYGIESFCGGESSWFHDNTIQLNSGWGISIGDGECGGVSNTVVESNTVMNNSLGGIYFYGSPFGRGGTLGANGAFGNNVVYNSGPGMRIEGDDGTLIGSFVDSSKSNTFAFNGGPGVEVVTASGQQFGINSTIGNGGIGFDVNPDPAPNPLPGAGDGPNANDTGDSLPPQNYPVLSAVTFNTATGGMRMQGSLDTSNTGPFTVLAFGGNPGADYEGPDYLGQFSVASGGAIDATIPYFTSMAGSYAGITVNATSTASGSQSSELSGLLSLPQVTQSATALNFGSVIVGNSATLPVTLSNVSGFTLLSATSPATGFSVDGSACAAPTGLTCIVNVTFTPPSASAFAGTIEFLSNSGSLQKLAVTGSGGVLAAGISLSPSALTFPAQSVGTTSIAQEIVLTNTGSGPLTISGIATTAGDFGHSSNCPASPSALAAGAFCKIFVTFSPLIAGDRTGSLAVTSNASTGSGTASLFGVGVAGAVPSVLVSPNPVLFPLTLAGSTSVPMPVQVRNTGTAPLTISSAFADSPEFQISSSTCQSPVALLAAKVAGPVSVAPGEACVINVVFAPYSPGTYISMLRIFSNVLGSPTLVSLQAVATDATSPEPVITLAATPISLDFGSQVTGTTSAARTIIVSNSGNAAATISGVTVTGDFAQANDCTNIPAGGNCTISVTFTPSATGGRSGSIVVAGNASNAPLTLGLAGQGILPQNPVIELSVTSLSFGNTIVGVGAGARTVTVRNVGGVPLAVLEIGGPFEFPVSSRCASALLPGGTCQFDVGFQPTVPGSRAGNVTVLSNAANGPASVGVSGTGCRITLQNRVPALVCR